MGRPFSNCKKATLMCMDAVDHLPWHCISCGVLLLLSPPLSSIHLQVFDYYNVINNTGFHNHFPVQEMVCSAKLRYTPTIQYALLTYSLWTLPNFFYSSVCYNPYHKSTLASSDYDGCVCVWDTGSGKQVVTHQVLLACLGASQAGTHRH